MKPIRNSAKAVIIQDNKVLLTKNQDRDGYFYLFPGGGQEHGEELSEALRRECIEEIGCAVIVDHLLHVREYIGKTINFPNGTRLFIRWNFIFNVNLNESHPHLQEVILMSIRSASNGFRSKSWSRFASTLISWFPYCSSERKRLVI